MKKKPPLALTTQAAPPYCVICGERTAIEYHHVGGRNHAAFTLPLCRRHHVDITKGLLAADVDMTFTSDKVERIARALQATTVFQWQLLSELRR